MKVARFVLKIVALSLALAAAICAIIAYWDKLGELFEKMCIEIWLERANKSELTEMQSFLIHHHVQGSLAIVARWARNDYKNPKELIVNAMSIADQAAEDFIMKE